MTEAYEEILLRLDSTDLKKKILARLFSLHPRLVALAQEGVSHRLKSDDSPVTEADELVHVALKEELEDQLGFQFVSEEAASNSGADHMSTFWIVDPLDGTKEFVKQI